MNAWALYLYESGARLALSLGAMSKDAITATWGLVQQLQMNATFAKFLSELTMDTLATK